MFYSEGSSYARRGFSSGLDASVAPFLAPNRSTPAVVPVLDFRGDRVWSFGASAAAVAVFLPLAVRSVPHAV